VRQIAEHLDFNIEDMLFVGDAIFPGGNDYSPKEVGIESIQVSGPGEVKTLIEKWNS